MKKTKFLLSVLIAAVFLDGCEFSVGAKKDLHTGLSASYKGLSAENIFLATADDAPLNNNEITLGSKVKIIADGVDNFKIVNNKVFPGCTILLLSAANDSIIYVPDAYQDLKDGKAANEANYLTASLNTGDPMQVNGTYSLKIRFYDKQDTTHYIKAECTIKMLDKK